jgi:DNA polymerase-3 subunit chi
MMAATAEFHTGVPDMVDFACRLLRKAYRRGATVLCLAPRARLELLDRQLWTFAERDFIPHVLRGAASARAVQGRTPIWLAAEWSPAGAQREVVLNLGGPCPVQAASAGRVIEVVGTEEGELERGRLLWREYKVAGVEVVHHPFGAAREG